MEIKQNEVDLNKNCPNLEGDKICGTCKNNEEGNCNGCKLIYTNWQPLNLIVNKWYKHKSTKAYCLYTNMRNKVGFTGNGYWKTDFILTNTTRWEIADMKEVEKLLLNEAKKRYPVGTKYKSLCDNEFQNEVFSVNDRGLKFVCESDNKIFFKSNGAIFSEAFGFVYYKGEWAEIVKELALMLGNVEVRLRNLNLIGLDKEETNSFNKKEHPGVITHFVYSKCVCTEKGNSYVLIEEWLAWFKIVDHFYEHAITGKVELKLGAYTTLSEVIAEMYTKIGCITNITYDQLRMVTEAIKKQN